MPLDRGGRRSGGGRHACSDVRFRFGRAKANDARSGSQWVAREQPPHAIGQGLVDENGVWTERRRDA